MKVKIRTVLTVFSIVLGGLSANAQDLLANQAPVDKRMRSLDSISLRRMLPNYVSPVSGNFDNPSADLYPSWNNTRGRDYGVAKPKEYNIDLRHFCMPCDSRLVTSHYGYRPQFGRNHYGTDIKLYVGDTVRSAFAGKIRVVAYEAKGYGNYVIIRHDNGLETVYGHMSKHLVRENQVVRAGEPIGLGGNTGRSTGSHLHFETRFLGEYIDPEILFDFQAHDVKADCYVYRSNGKGSLLGVPYHAEAPMMASTSVASSGRNVETASAEKTKEEASAKKEKAVASKESAKKKDGNKSKKRIHSVQKGDTLYSIAHKYDITVEQLCKLNHISESATIRPGQVLKCS